MQVLLILKIGLLYIDTRYLNNKQQLKIEKELTELF